MAIYNTQIQWDVVGDKWRDAPQLFLIIESPEIRKWGNAHDVVPETGHPSTGTKVCWSSPKGNAEITFSDGGQSFYGWHQAPRGSRAAYRGQLYEG
jgi:hypothetical protein